jgi:hypothetical protein
MMVTDPVEVFRWLRIFASTTLKPTVVRRPTCLYPLEPGPVLRIRICIIFPGSGFVPGFLGSGALSYSNKHNKINWKGKFNKVPYAFWLGPGGPTDKETQVKMFKKCCTVLGTLPLWNSKDRDPYQTVWSRSVSCEKQDLNLYKKVLDPQHWPGLHFFFFSFRAFALFFRL